MGTKNKQQGQKLEQANQSTQPNENNKVTGNPNDVINNAANENPTQPTAQFEQIVNTPEEVDKLLVQKMKEVAQTAYNFSIKYSEIPGDFKKLGDAMASYAQVYEQKLAMESANKKQQSVKK